jgi:hypothetical protein
MPTIFTIPKAFSGQAGVAQRNAVRSWLALRPECEIILFGDDPGVAACAQELGVRHVPEVQGNEFGTPRLDDVFAQAERMARFPTLCYANADIILPAGFPDAVRRVQARFRRFLMVGQCVDLRVDEELDFADGRTPALLDERARTAGALRPPVAMDYFVFPKGILGELPPFVVGRPGWDNWMIKRATQLRIPVVDASQSLHAIHQNHDYAHVPKSTGGYEGPEADQNRRFLTKAEYHFATSHANWRLTSAGLVRYPWWKHQRGVAMLMFETAYPRMKSVTPAVRFLLNARDSALIRLSGGYRPGSSAR